MTTSATASAETLLRPPAPRATLAPILAPRTVAVVGASRRPESMGHQILHNILTYGYTGTVYPVNPGASSIRAVRAYPSVRELPEPVDLAVIVVPKDHVLDVAQECGESGVKGLVVISAGFREMGPAGRDRERALLEIVRRHGIRMVGPNCMGVINVDPAVSMNATFATVMPPFGHAAFVSQSGALGLNVLDHAREYGIGIAQFVSVGNKADVSGNDLLMHWEHDPSVQVILMYVENFGNPAKFLEIAGRITRRKPIIVVKSGRSQAGARAASSHTGALAASDVTVDALLAQAGVLRASSIEELFDMAMAFEARSLPKSRRTAVLTNAGGPGILAADALEGFGVELPELSPATVDALRPLFPAEASIRNPLDMIASATPAGYRHAMSALLADPAIDAVVPIFVPPFGVRQEDVADSIIGAAQQSTKPVLAVLMGSEGLPYGRSELQSARIPTYVFPESAARALAALNRQVEWSSREARTVVPLADVDRDAVVAIVDRVRREGRTQLNQLEALDVLRAYGIEVAPAVLATTMDAALQAAQATGYPVVLKVVSRDIVHKTEVGGVRVNVPDDASLRIAYGDMLAQIAAKMPDARVDGIMVQAMIGGGVETIVGMSRDPSFGPLIMFGLGGIFVEVLKDVVFRIAPLSADEALGMTRSIRASALLDGLRGATPVSRTAIAATIQRIAQLAIDHPAIAELDVNPLLARTESVIALDARIAVR